MVDFFFARAWSGDIEASVHVANIVGKEMFKMI